MELRHSIVHRLTTRITHRTIHFEKGVEREVDPYRLWYANNGIYLVAHDHNSNELRSFAVERILTASPTNRRFEIPADFNFEKFSESAFNVIWGDPQEVKIRFSSDQAPYIQERTWHPSQKIEKHADGSIDLTMQVGNLWEIKRWLIGYGADAQVVQPRELAKDIERECARVLHIKKPRKTR